MQLLIPLVSAAFQYGELAGKILFWLALAIGSIILVLPNNRKKKGKDIQKESPTRHN